MPRKRLKEIYERVFFDPLMLVGIIFVSLTYILRSSWGGAFTESAAFVIGIVWSYRAATTNPSVGYRLLAALVMILIGSLLAIYLGAAHGLI
ncbi:MAG TPA: hypothetical protein VGH44_00915 [Candidatus Saccharimonadia bacterium]|jgi:hypothetical protein